MEGEPLIPGTTTTDNNNNYNNNYNDGYNNYNDGYDNNGNGNNNGNNNDNGLTSPIPQFYRNNPVPVTPATVGHSTLLRTKSMTSLLATRTMVSLFVKSFRGLSTSATSQPP